MSILNVRKALSIIEKTANLSIVWFAMSEFKDYLRSVDQSIDSLPMIHSYLLQLQEEKFIFDCESTYVAICDEELIILAREKYSIRYRLDIMSISDDTYKWEGMPASLNILLRMRNAIEFSGALSDDPEELAVVLTEQSEETAMATSAFA